MAINLRIPVEIWEVIADNTPPNPLIYSSWAHVCRGARKAFMRDWRWKKFTPVPGEHDLYLAFHERFNSLPENIRVSYRDLFEEVRDIWSWNQELNEEKYQYQTMRVVVIRKTLFVEFSDNLHFPDYIMVSVTWLHLACLVWWPESVRKHQVHAAVVRQKFHGWYDRHFVLAAATLYGPLLRYAAEEFYDDKEIVLASARYHIPLPYCDDLSNEWTRWRLVSPYHKLSHRLKCDKEVTLTFIRRWPHLCEYVPNELKNDPDVLIISKDAPIYEECQVPYVVGTIGPDPDLLDAENQQILAALNASDNRD